MEIKEFVLKYYSFAKSAELKTGVPCEFILAQAALETGWGAHSPGNMMFGVKDTDGINGNEQLITTTEYSKKDNLKFPVIISKVFNPVTKLYKYIVKNYFRKYDTPEESFVDHAELFVKTARYADNFIKCGKDPYKWCDEVAKDGYATDPNYARKLRDITKMIMAYIK